MIKIWNTAIVSVLNIMWIEIYVVYSYVYVVYSYEL